MDQPNPTQPNTNQEPNNNPVNPEPMSVNYGDTAAPSPEIDTRAQPILSEEAAPQPAYQAPQSATVPDPVSVDLAAEGLSASTQQPVAQGQPIIAHQDVVEQLNQQTNPIGSAFAQNTPLNDAGASYSDAGGPQIQPALAQSSDETKPEIEIETMSMDYKTEEDSKAAGQTGPAIIPENKSIMGGATTIAQPAESSKKIIMIAGIVFGVLVLATGVYFAFDYLNGNPVQEEGMIAVPEVINEPAAPQKSQQEVLNEKIDLANTEIGNLDTTAFEKEINSAAADLDKILQ